MSDWSCEVVQGAKAWSSIPQEGLARRLKYGTLNGDVKLIKAK